jgi:MarR family transcriptional regulator, organic hydroperoxide resistance regulator
MYIHTLSRADTTLVGKEPMKTYQYPCLCAVIRKTGRVLTRKYDRYLKASGLKVTQFSMLANIMRNPGITVSELARMLFMDQTTVTRNLRVLEKSAYVHLGAEATDSRIRRILVSNIGKAKMDEARPFWQKAQRDMERLLGRETIEELLGTLNKITG